MRISKKQAEYKGQTDDDKHCSVCSMFIPPNGCTIVKGDIAPGGWCKYFKRSIDSKLERLKQRRDPFGIKKAEQMTDTFSFFLPIMKMDEEKRLVCGYASTPTKDSDGEIVTLEAVKAALPEYMAWGNVREMHKLSAVGTAQESHVDDKGLFLSAKLVDDIAWQKCKEGVYKGFSIGGRKLAKQGNKITELEMTEISVVDRPANPDARFALAKSAKALGEAPGYLVKIKDKTLTHGKALVKMAKIVDGLTKSGPQAAHDGFSLPAKLTDKQPDGVASPNDSRPNENVTRKGDTDMVCDKHGKANCTECVDKRKFTTEQRTAAADTGAALPDGSYPIKNKDDLKNAIQAFGRGKNKDKVKAHIKLRAESLGATDMLPEKWKTSKVEKRLAKARMERVFDLRGEAFLTLKKAADVLTPDENESEVLDKGMSGAGSLAYCFDSIRNIQRSLMMEGKREGGDGKDKALAKQLGTIAKQLAAVIGQKASHEGDEALDLSDADDQYLQQYLGEGVNKMYENDDEGQPLAKTGDPLADAIATLVKRAAAPSRASRMAMAKDNVKKARQAAKAARSAVEEAHAMHKAAYIAKAAKKDKGGDDGEFDHAGAMEKLQKAYQDIDKARVFGKAAEAQLEKLSRSGERGQEANDAENGFYTVPAGVKDISPDAMAGAKPGTPGGGGGMPPDYPASGGVYAGKVADLGDLKKYADKNGQVPANVVQLLLEKAQAAGELEALRRLPAAGVGGRQRPFAFDMTKVAGGDGGAGKDDLNKVLFDGVNVGAINSNDERAHVEASARVIGNLLTSGRFGKSIVDPSFKGAAGTH